MLTTRRKSESHSIGWHARLIVATLAFLSLCQSTIADDLKDFSTRMAYFYQAPSAEAFKSFQQDAERLLPQLEGKKNGANILTAVMIARISEKHDWPIENGRVGDVAKNIKQGYSPLAQYIWDDARVDAGKLDIWWASFFATGDEQYLEKIFSYAELELPKDKKEAGRLLIVGAAKWSFTANCRQHEKVLEFAKRKLDANDIAQPRREFINTCIQAASAKPTGQSAAGEANAG